VPTKRSKGAYAVPVYECADCGSQSVSAVSEDRCPETGIPRFWYDCAKCHCHFYLPADIRSEASFRNLVDAWIAAVDASTDSDDPKYWAVNEVISWDIRQNPETMWRFILAVCKRDLSMQTTGRVAAGPIEDLLSQAGELYIGRVEFLARRDPKFRKVLGGVWQLSMSDEVWGRLCQARGDG
jgi:hypothetical protein